MKKVEVVELKQIDIRLFSIRLEGTTPLICHRFSEKAKREILDREMKKSKTTGHEIKDPVRDFIDSLYWLSGKPEIDTIEYFDTAVNNGARFGFPVLGFKEAAVSAGYRSGVSKDKVSLYGAFHLVNAELTQNDGMLVQVFGTPYMREDYVKIQQSASMRYRGEFRDWYTDLDVQYNAGAFSAEQIVNLFHLAGFVCGVGEWRPEKGGQNGMFKVTG